MNNVTAAVLSETGSSEFRRGWPVVLACFCTATFAWGFGFYGLSVYFADLHATPTPVNTTAVTTTILISRFVRAA